MFLKTESPAGGPSSFLLPPHRVHSRLRSGLTSVPFAGLTHQVCLEKPFRAEESLLPNVDLLAIRQPIFLGIGRQVSFLFLLVQIHSHRAAFLFHVPEAPPVSCGRKEKGQTEESSGVT